MMILISTFVGVVAFLIYLLYNGHAIYLYIMQSSGPGGDRFSLRQTCKQCLTILGEFADTTLFAIGNKNWQN